MVAFTFGLLHGFGFAGALSEVGLPQSAIPVALLFFNVGVRARSNRLYRRRCRGDCARAPNRDAHPSAATGVVLLHPALMRIGSVAMFWGIERIAAF